MRHISLMTAVVFLASCAPMSTYPPVEYAAATKITRPTFEPVPTVMAVAIEYARQHLTPDSDPAINLPRGAGPEVYEKIIKKLDGEGRPMTRSDEPAIHIVEVRTRGFHGEVDMIYTKPEGFNDFVTLFLRRSAVENWHVDRTRPWRMRSITLPQPNYVPPPVDDKVENPNVQAPKGNS
jgi:hypothetical protein